jgi:hypothetical protein
VEPIDHVLRGNTDCTDKKGGLLFDHDVREFK